MVYKILEADPVINIHKFFVDNVADLETLPKEPASTALVAATGDTYICNNVGKWVMYIDNPIEDSGSGSTQSYPITVTGDAGAYIFDGQGYPTVQITERAAGEYVVIKADKQLSSENTGVFGDTVDYVPVLFDYSSDAPNQAYFIMPAGATEIAVS